MDKEHFLFEQMREVWKDIRSQTSNIWQLAAFSFGVIGIAANIIVTGNPPMYTTHLGYLILLFICSFLLLTSFFQLWLRSSILGGIHFIKNSETKLLKLNLLEQSVTMPNDEESETLYLPLGNALLGLPASWLFWFLYITEIAVCILWLYQGVMILSPPLSFLNRILLVIPPITLLLGSYEIPAWNEKLSSKYSMALPTKSDGQLRRLMAIWAVLHQKSFTWFWDRL